MKTIASPVVLLLTSLTLSCSPTPDVVASPGKTGHDAGSDAGPTPLVFSPCTLLTDPAYPPAPSGALASVGEYDGVPSALAAFRAAGGAYTDYATTMAECATLRVPAMWSDPKGPSIDVFVKRLPASRQPARTQLWLLNGGPGYAGPLFESEMFLFAKTIPDVDIYVPDFRGTGKSTFAKCSPDSSAQYDCTDVFPPLAGLTITDAAKDVGALIDASQPGAKRVFVQGLSYGTYWAQRYMLVRPDQATAVILDSSVPIGSEYADFDRQFDDNGHSLLELCKTDATCSAKLGPDPIAKANEALAAVDAEACPLKARIGDVRNFLGASPVGEGQFDRSLFPAAIYRMLRCNDADLAWFDKVSGFFQWWSGPWGQGANAIVVRNVALSESWHTSITAGEIAARHKSQIASTDYSLGLAFWAERWPRYPEDQYFGKWPEPSIPVLTLQGTLDPRTPYGDVMKAHYSGPNQHYVEFPNANHGIFFPTVTPMVDPAAPGCGWQVIRSFFEDPTRQPDTSCIAGLAPVYSDPPKEWYSLVGIQDLWENP